MYSYLKQHPEIYLSPTKEPRFFAFEGMDLNFRGPGDEKRFNDSVLDLESYQALFAGVKNQKAIGEGSVTYLYYANCAERIRTFIPNVKLVALIRHPADRAHSNFLSLRYHEPANSFAEALELEDFRVRENWSHVWHYVRRGYYYTQLKPYFDVFDPTQIKICLYDDYSANPVALMQDVFRFLGVDDRFVPDTSKRYNVSKHTVSSGLVKPGLLKPILKKVFPSEIRHWIGQPRRQNSAKSATPPTVRRQLTEVFQEEITRLQGLIQRDLSAWLS